MNNGRVQPAPTADLPIADCRLPIVRADMLDRERGEFRQRPRRDGMRRGIALTPPRPLERGMAAGAAILGRRLIKGGMESAREGGDVAIARALRVPH